MADNSNGDPGGPPTGGPHQAPSPGQHPGHYQGQPQGQQPGSGAMAPYNQGHHPAHYAPPQHVQGQYAPPGQMPPVNVVVQNHLAPTGPYAMAHRYHSRERIPAAVLAFFFGFLGAHKFYLGRPAAGIVYLLFFWTGIPAMISFFEGLSYLLTPEATFDARHNYVP